MSQSDLKKVRLSVHKNIGNKVKIRANRGRHKIDVTEGVISQTFPSIFLVEVENELNETTQTLSFSYTDVLTRDVQMQLI
ncbi:MAG: Veg family protein [Lachnospiraceae bacterium]|nr:Veg family protein [Lachnospiraceae bacterium]